MEERHHLNFATYELGEMTLDGYLEQVVFYKDRNFTPFEFKVFMYEQSKPYPEMIEMMIHSKKQYQLKVVAVSNEARELNPVALHLRAMNMLP